MTFTFHISPVADWRRPASGQSRSISKPLCQNVFIERRAALLAAILLIGASARAPAQLPNSFGSDLHRVASARFWLRNFGPRRYQWLPDGRLLVWVGAESPRAQLLDPVTGKHDSLILFNRLVIYGCPPETGIRFYDLTPDGKSGVSFIGRFTGPDLYSRTLSLDGYNMLIHTLNRQFAWTLQIAWEWNAGHHGWVTYGSFNNGRTSRVMAVVHSELAHPEQPRIVEINQSAMPGWAIVDVNDSAHIIGVVADGKGIMAPQPDFLLSHPAWARQHGMPISLIDIDQGKQPAIDFEIHIPLGAQAESFILSPDTTKIAWLLRYPEPHAVPGHSKLYSTDEIWISDLDGGQMRRLAYQAGRVGNSDSGLRFLAWKDTQTVSFIRDNMLYAYPVK